MGLEKKKHTPKQNRTSISSPTRNVSLPLTSSNTSTTPSRGLSQGKAALYNTFFVHILCFYQELLSVCMSNIILYQNPHPYNILYRHVYTKHTKR